MANEETWVESVDLCKDHVASCARTFFDECVMCHARRQAFHDAAEMAHAQLRRWLGDPRSFEGIYDFAHTLIDACEARAKGEE